MVNVRSKGASAEREAAIWIQKYFSLEFKPERNLEQVRKGGHDLLGFPPFAFEIKRQEILYKRDWWLQAVTSITKTYPIPVVMYRQSKRKWKFLISAKHIGLKNGFIELEEREFVMWATNLLHTEITADIS